MHRVLSARLASRQEAELDRKAAGDDLASELLHELQDQWEQALKLVRDGTLPILVSLGFNAGGVEEFRFSHLTFQEYFVAREIVMRFPKGKIEDACEIIKKNGNAYVKDGALWLESSKYGHDNDRVVIREDGRSTYFA